MLENLESSEEKVLIENSLNGCEKSFKFLVEKQKNKLLPLKNLITGITKEDWEDCLQNASYKSFINLKKFNQQCAFNTWFYSILRNEILMLAKKKNSLKSKEISIEELSNLNHSKSNFSDNEKYDRILNFRDESYMIPFYNENNNEKFNTYNDVIQYCFDKIEPKYKDVLSLAYLENKSRKEIANTLQIPIGSVLSRIYVANKKAKKIITHYIKNKNIELENINVRD